jgi:hypothetical protein
MSGFWWTWGPGEQDAPVETPTVFSNAPSLWSGGVRWGDTAGPFDDGTDAYWGNVNAAVGRTGAPRLSVAIDGRLVLEQLRSANWTLGRRDWLSTLTPTSASFEFNDEPIVAINDTIVVGLMSDVAESHSDALWSGRVASFGTREEITGFTFTNISATDIIGILGQADAPATISAGHNLVSLVELLASNAGLDVEVDKDPLVTLPTLSAAGSSTDPIGGKVIDLINRAERSSNALLFLRGNGRLYAAMRNTTGASAVQVLDLDGEDSTTVWATETSVDSVVTRWKLGGTGDWSSDTQATTFDEYGDHTFSAEDLLIVDPAPYAPLIASDVMAHPRPIVTEAPIPIRSLEQKALYLDPLDRVSRDGTTWQVMQVDHTVSPLRLEDGQTVSDWRVNLTADRPPYRDADVRVVQGRDRHADIRWHGWRHGPRGPQGRHPVGHQAPVQRGLVESDRVACQHHPGRVRIRPTHHRRGGQQPTHPCSAPHRVMDRGRHDVGRPDLHDQGPAHDQPVPSAWTG